MTIEDELHEAHHRWIEAQIQKEKWRSKFWEKMAVHAAKWGVVSVLSALGYAVYLGLREWGRELLTK